MPRSLVSRFSRTLLHPSGRLYAGVSALAPSNRLFLRLSSPPPDHPYKKGRSNRPPPAPLAPVGSFRRVWAVRLSDSPRKSGDWGLQAGCFRNGLFPRTPTTLLDKAFRPLLPQLFGSPGGRYGQVNPVASFSVPTSPSIPQSPIPNPECLPRYKRVSVPTSPTASSRTTMQQQRVRIRLQAYEVL